MINGAIGTLTRQQHLLIKLMEECSEVIQASSKVLLFGKEDQHPDLFQNNEERLHEELNDLYGLIQMLAEEGFLTHTCNVRIERRIAKTEHYIDYAKERGLVSCSNPS